MANTNKSFLDLTGLTAYNTAIKNWANSVNQIAFKTAHASADGSYLYLYKKPSAVLGTDTPDASIAIGGDASAKLDALAATCGATWNSATSEYDITLDSTFASSTDTIVKALNELKNQINSLDAQVDTATVNSNVVTIKSGIVQSDGLIGIAPNAAKSTVVDGYLYNGKFYENSDHTGEITLDTSKSYHDLSTGGKTYNYDGSNLLEVKADIVLAEVAVTGAAADVSIADAGSLITATTVEGALQEIAGNVNGKDVYMTDDTSTSGTDYAQIYKIYQGSGSAASPVQGELVGTINIPKDQFVDSADLVDIVFKASDNTLHEGSESGPDVTEAIMGSVTPTAENAGKYLKLVFAITTGIAAKSTIYISIKELSHVYTGGSTSEVTVSIDSSTDVITASIVDIDGTKITYIAADAGTSTPRESVTAALTRLDGSDSTTGSVAKKVKDAIDALDTTSDVVTASYAAGSGGTADVITLTGSIKEEDGVIETGTADTITLSTITSTEISSLFS